MRRYLLLLFLCSFIFIPVSHATVFGEIQGIVHDPQHRPLPGAAVTIHAVHSSFSKTATTNGDGYFALLAVPLGEYRIEIAAQGFDRLEQTLRVASDSSPILHFQLQVGSVQQSVKVTSQTDVANVNSVTPTTTINRIDIARTPGGDRTNSQAMITNYVPGAYMVHDMLHMRGGHQVSWEIDGVDIPNTNIASNLGAQIDPKDIDYLEVQRGSYNADVGDRTYGVFNVAPRTGFERSREAELVTSYGSFNQTNDQFNFGDHTERFAYYASLNGNRTDYGLMPPVSKAYHDAANGYGGFNSLVYNRTPRDQLRLVSQLRTDYFQIPYDPNPDSLENQLYNSSGLRDGQHEVDGFSAFTWAHSFNSTTLLQLSPFYHYNSANYQPNPQDMPVATTSDRATNYGGVQASLSTEWKKHTLQAGFYSFGQHDGYTFGSRFNDGSFPNFSVKDSAAGGLIEEYVSDNYKATSWLTLIAGLRSSQFRGTVSESDNDPRFGIAVQIPKLNWVFRAFYGRYYQAPPLLTAAGPLIGYANSTNTAFTPLHGERDEEHQFGLQIPFHGWLLDADTFKTRANNFLDHSNVGESNIFFPVTIDGALIQAWELTIHSPTIARLGQVHLAYSNQVAQQRGPITGGLICTPVSSPQCDAGFSYTPLDHDQRNTLNAGIDSSLPWHAYGSANLYYGSGFTNGDPNAQYPGEYLPHDTSLNLALGKVFREKTTLSVNATNVTNHRVLLDNSLTFGGFHYNDPREIYGEVRYRFHY
ncbi:MAG: TonB-dependent receptor [Acidobacteria bacterium]|nr:TonB-dependent receptor [Acidobacteriota bacterium]MBW4045005.1 TonB-dependent receptor [Acidobacteriota bacterium]